MEDDEREVGEKTQYGGALGAKGGTSSPSAEIPWTPRLLTTQMRPKASLAVRSCSDFGTKPNLGEMPRK